MAKEVLDKANFCPTPATWAFLHAGTRNALAGPGAAFSVLQNV